MQTAGDSAARRLRMSRLIASPVAVPTYVSLSPAELDQRSLVVALSPSCLSTRADADAEPSFSANMNANIAHRPEWAGAENHRHLIARLFMAASYFLVRRRHLPQLANFASRGERAKDFPHGFVRGRVRTSQRFESCPWTGLNWPRAISLNIFESHTQTHTQSMSGKLVVWRSCAQHTNFATARISDRRRTPA